MTRIKIKSLVWDAWNLEHIQKHKISAEEVEVAGKNLIYHRKTYGGRYLAIGRSKKKLITLILKRKNTGQYYIVTARDLSRREIQKVYEKEK